VIVKIYKDSAIIPAEEIKDVDHTEIREGMFVVEIKGGQFMFPIRNIYKVQEIN